MSDGIILIGDLDKAMVLAALYNAARPQGMGFMHYDPTPMTAEEAGEILASYQNFDYMKGRVMKIDLSGDDFSPWSYDRDNGPGAAQTVINDLSKNGDVNSTVIQGIHQGGKGEAISAVEGSMTVESSFTQEGSMASMNLGLSDVVEHLRPKVDEAKGRHS